MLSCVGKWICAWALKYDGVVERASVKEQQHYGIVVRLMRENEWFV